HPHPVDAHRHGAEGSARFRHHRRTRTADEPSASVRGGEPAEPRTQPGNHDHRRRTAAGAWGDRMSTTPENAESREASPKDRSSLDGSASDLWNAAGRSRDDGG